MPVEKMKQIWNNIKAVQEYKQARAFRNVLREVLEKKKLREDVTIGDYDTPAWSHKQAHRNGYNAAIKDILELITGEGDA